MAPTRCVAPPPSRPAVLTRALGYAHLCSFGDLNKLSSDLLNNDYCFDKKFKLTTKAANGLVLTSEGTLNKVRSLDYSLGFRHFLGVALTATM